MSASIDQASKAMGYISGLFASVPHLHGMWQAETFDTIRTTNQVDIQARPASWRTIRGGTFVAGVGDEVCFWRSEETSNPDSEVLNAVRPGLATTGGPLIVISSVHARKGEAFATWEKHFGPDGDPMILVAHAASRTMNSSLPEKLVQRALDRDRAVAGAEYLSEWRSDVETFVDRSVVMRATPSGLVELPPSSVIRYSAFTDPAGGSGADSFTLSIAHKEGEDAVLDAVREATPPFSPEMVTKEFSALLKSYGVSKVVGDRFAGEWPRERFREHGITYEPSSRTKSDIYVAALPALNSGRARLLDIPRLTSQLCALERRTARGGRDSVDHPRRAHDDVANAACGALVGVGDAPQAVVVTADHLAYFSRPGLRMGGRPN